MQVAGASSDRDSPRAAFALLSWRVNLAVVVALFALSALAWRSTIQDAVSMRGMVMGFGQIGWLAQGDMSAGIFLAMWVTMMAAMMLPAIAPMVLAHLGVMRRRGRGIVPTLVFIAGYLLVWSAIGAVPLLVYKAFAPLSEDPALLRWLPVLAGTILILAGAYQFSAWKRICLDHCQSPFAFLASHDFDGGSLSALRAGLIHGALCLGCCWAIMTVLLLVGLMNLLWMAGIFALIVVEKNWKHGLLAAKVAGVALVVLGAAVIARPGLLAAISLP
jgi:predicted metal-binding membrane protein